MSWKGITLAFGSREKALKVYEDELSENILCTARMLLGVPQDERLLLRDEDNYYVPLAYASVVHNGRYCVVAGPSATPSATLSASCDTLGNPPTSHTSSPPSEAVPLSGHKKEPVTRDPPLFVLHSPAPAVLGHGPPHLCHMLAPKLWTLQDDCWTSTGTGLPRFSTDPVARGDAVTPCFGVAVVAGAGGSDVFAVTQAEVWKSRGGMWKQIGSNKLPIPLREALFAASPDDRVYALSCTAPMVYATAGGLWVPVRFSFTSVPPHDGTWRDIDIRGQAKGFSSRALHYHRSMVYLESSQGVFRVPGAGGAVQVLQPSGNMTTAAILHNDRMHVIASSNEAGQGNRLDTAVQTVEVRCIEEGTGAQPSSATAISIRDAIAHTRDRSRDITGVLYVVFSLVKGIFFFRVRCSGAHPSSPFRTGCKCCDHALQFGGGFAVLPGGETQQLAPPALSLPPDSTVIEALDQHSQRLHRPGMANVHIAARGSRGFILASDKGVVFDESSRSWTAMAPLPDTVDPGSTTVSTPSTALLWSSRLGRIPAK